MNNALPFRNNRAAHVPPMTGGGRIGDIVRTTDWSATPLGDYATWPQSLRSSLSLVLNASGIAALYWGPEQRLLYNDAYGDALGERHPWAFGRPIAEALSDIAPLLLPQVAQVMASGAGLALENVPMTMNRHGREEQTVWTYSFSPIQGETGGCAGVVLFATEMTRQAEAERSAFEARRRQQRLLDKMPCLNAMLTGPRHVCEYGNETVLALDGGRDLLGRPLFDVFPELAGSRFHAILDRIHATGTGFSENSMPFRLGNGNEDRYFNVHGEPVLDDAGQIAGIFLGGYEVTEQHRAILALSTLNTNLEKQVA